MPQRTDDDEQDEQAVRRAVGLADPLRHVDVRPLDVSAADLRDRAGAKARKTTRRRWLARAGIAVLNVMAVTAAAFIVNTAYAAPATLPMDRADPAPTAAQWLRATAAHLVASGTSGPLSTPDTGSVYTHLQRWSMDTTSRARDIVAFDEHRWWARDRSARVAITVLPPQPPGLRHARFLDAVPDPAAVTEYPPGGYSTVVDTPSADPAVLATQLREHEPAANGPQAVVRSIAAVHEFHRLGLAQRLAMLDVLSRVDGLAWRGTTTDRAGRAGVALTIDSGGPDTGRVRDVLVVDGKASLLSHEQIALTPPPALPDLPRYTVTFYVLFVS